MAPKYPCFRCGKKSVASEMVYSRTTGRRFCSDYDACARRVKRQKGKKNV